MATTVWKGHLTFGLVSIPVRLFKAARPQRVALHRLHRAPPLSSAPPPAPSLVPKRGFEPIAPQDSPEAGEPVLTRIREQPVVYTTSGNATATAPQPVSRENLVRGYEYEKNQYAVIENEELQSITPETSTEMEILEFVRLEEIDPVYFETSYYMTPEEAGEKAYALLFEAMRSSGFAALAEVAMHRREHMVILRPGKHGIITHTMFFADEVRSDQEFHADASLVNDRERKLAKTLVEGLAAPFEPGKYRDKFRQRLEDLIAAKVDGKAVAEIAAPKRAAAVVDMTAALEQSLKMVRKPASAETKAAPNKRKAPG